MTKVDDLIREVQDQKGWTLGAAVETVLFYLRVHGHGILHNNETVPQVDVDGFRIWRGLRVRCPPRRR